MPPKSKKASAAERARDVQETEDPLQAIVLADSFETRFSPFSAETPRCLLPLANTPLIEYTLEFLAGSGVEEVYIYCGAHTSQIEEYFKDSKWMHSASPFRLELIRSVSKSVGDALRDLDSKDIMSGDFLVVYGDVVSNLSLSSALAEHRARRAKDKNAIMTLVLREDGVGHSTQDKDVSPVFIVDPTKDRCLHYEQISPQQPNKYVELDSDLLKSNQELEVRYDLQDCGIDICTPEVLALWSDNFDYEAPRKNFLHSVLKDYELNGKTIHTHILKDGYAARVRNLNAYNRVSRDIVSRYTYPMCPDSNLLPGHSYRYRKRNIYEEPLIDTTWTTTIGANTVLANGTKVGKRSEIKNSIIGRNCHIGDDCVIEDTYVWDNVTVGNSSHIHKSIIANDVVIGQSCTIQKGSLLSYGVKIADGMFIPKRQRITRFANSRDGNTASSDAKIVGVDGIGRKFVPSDLENNDNDDDNDNDEDEDEHDYGNAAKAETNASFYMSPDSAESTESISTLNSESSSMDEVSTKHIRTMSSLSETSEDSRSTSQQSDFQLDAVSSLYDALKEGTEVSTIQLELQSLRLALNASEHQVRKAVVNGLVRYLVEARRNGTATVKEVLKNNTLLFQRIMFDKSKEVKEDQVDLLLLIQKDVAGRKEEEGSEGMMLQFCNELYMLDLLEQEALEQWWADDRSKTGSDMNGVREQVERFMQVLVEAETESESEGESASEEDEEDESEEE